MSGGDADSLRARLDRSLGDTFRIERELGGGGMSRVFLAEERALGRRVVVKVLAPELAHELSTERFAREIRLLAQLQHPNIVPVLSAGAAADVPYYTMPRTTSRRRTHSWVTVIRRFPGCSRLRTTDSPATHSLRRMRNSMRCAATRGSSPSWMWSSGTGSGESSHSSCS